jgi:hypothetical protein
MLLSPDWLSLALEPRFPGIRVTRVRPGPLVSRVSMNARFRIECAGGVPAGLSPDLCGKGYFGEAGRAFRHVGESEAAEVNPAITTLLLERLGTAAADHDVFGGRE